MDFCCVRLSRVAVSRACFGKGPLVVELSEWYAVLLLCGSIGGTGLPRPTTALPRPTTACLGRVLALMNPSRLRPCNTLLLRHSPLMPVVQELLRLQPHLSPGSCQGSLDGREFPQSLAQLFVQ